ncbi:hypothetical protein DPMN_020722 [Dreissena polymorpha]|uniref:Secreted protein n=1 Tax=Dreissena polymorpha TaxID=45954 RepID=A0A9D4NLJ1_DREPO|nr:hypothetical protein DPMN_020722 [Dreissena polymorpha]
MIVCMFKSFACYGYPYMLLLICCFATSSTGVGVACKGAYPCIPDNAIPVFCESLCPEEKLSVCSVLEE